jgi:hypothetical protein
LNKLASEWSNLILREKTIVQENAVSVTKEYLGGLKLLTIPM